MQHAAQGVGKTWGNTCGYLFSNMCAFGAFLQYNASRFKLINQSMR